MINFKECPVPILQNEWEFSILYDMFFKLNPKNIIEIGTFFGGTLWYWLRDDFRDTVCVIDMPITRIDPRYNKMVECRKQWVKWIDNVTEFIPMFANSTDRQVISEANKIFKDKKVDFLFIDGGHDYNTVKADFLNYSTLVRSGGMIVFHDILGEQGVSKYWYELKWKGGRIEILKEFGIGILYAV